MKILDFPELRQVYEYDCGANALQAVLAYYGLELSEELLLKELNTDLKTGTTTDNLNQVLIKYKLKYEAKKMTVEELKYYLDQKIPILLLLQAWNETAADYKNRNDNNHWVVAIGYDDEKIFFEDPYAFERTFLTDEELKTRWHAEENGEEKINYGIAVFGPTPTYNSGKIIHMD